MSNEELGMKYLHWIASQYDYLKNKYRKFCSEKRYDWDEDLFSDTYLKVYEKIAKSGIDDSTEKGFADYTFKAFKTNIQREKQYCRNSKRDLNLTDEVETLYEQWYNDNKDDVKAKIVNDLYQDFAILYLMSRVEDEFDAEHFYLFRLKYLVPSMTYKRLAEVTKIRGARQKVVTVKRWLQDNVSKDEVDRVFWSMYGNLL